MRLIQLAALFALACTTPYWVRRIEDRTGSRIQALLYGATLAAVAGTTSALLMVAMAPEVLEADNVVDVFTACFGALKTILSHPAIHIPALLAALLLGALLIRAAITGAKLALAGFRARREAQRLHDVEAEALIPQPWRGRVIVTGQEEPVAYVTGLLSPTIVVSSGLLDQLDEAERTATLAHEDAHRRHRHHWLLFGARCVARALSPLPPAAEAFRGLRRALEARADDEARRVATIDTLASAIAKAALGPAVAGSIAMGESDTVWRVRRLFANQKPRHLAGSVLLLASLTIFFAAQVITVASASTLIVAADQAGHHCKIPGWSSPSI